VLLGIVDMSRKSIHVAHALSEPEDSHGTCTGFERGVTGVLEDVNRAVKRSMYQLRYVGEWHSHPRFSPAMPSQIDIAQLEWLGRELAIEGQPGLMAIAAEDGQFGFVVHYKEAEAPCDSNDSSAADGRVR
jgi:JAB domain-containing protein similar to deubiquitination enzymes